MRQTFSPAKCAVLKFAAQIFRMQQSELVPHIHPFAAACGADSSSSDLHSGNRTSVSAPVSCLLTDKSAMTGFRPDSFRCFGTVLCAQLRSSGFPFLLRRSLPGGVLRLLYIGWQYQIVRKSKILCFSVCYYTRYGRDLQAV